MRLFFFGSLMDRELLCVVVGHDCAGLTFAPGRLPDYRTNRVKDEDYPLLARHDGGAVEGLVVDGLTADDIERIRYFEDDEYILEKWIVETETGPSECLICAGLDEADDSGEPWSPQDLDGNARDLLLLMTEEHMAYFGHLPIEQVTGLWEEIRAKAQARLARRGTVSD